MLKITSLFLSLSLLSFSQVMERKAVPISVMGDAKEAVKKLATEVRKGNFLYSLDNMYPRWKESMAKRIGGEEVLRKRLESVPKDMLDKGISITDFKVGEPEAAFEVNGDLLRDSKKSPTFSEYLVFVPTTSLYRVIDPQGGVVKYLEAQGFQIAVASKKTPTQWTFIDGSNIKMSDLRGLFPHLPNSDEALNLPSREMKELKLDK